MRSFCEILSQIAHSSSMRSAQQPALDLDKNLSQIALGDEHTKIHVGFLCANAFLVTAVSTDALTSNSTHTDSPPSDKIKIPLRSCQSLLLLPLFQSENFERLVTVDQCARDVLLDHPVRPNPHVYETNRLQLAAAVCWGVDHHDKIRFHQ